MIDTLLNALGYLGDALQKPGRAVRGVLGGRPEEALAALPFSDSLGLTSQADAVSGSDLLRQLGLDPGEGLAGGAAGFAADAATDPLTYLGGAALRGGLGLLDRSGSTLSKASATAARGAAEPGVYDLVSPAEREIDKLLPGTRGGESPLAKALAGGSEAAEPASAEAAEGAAGVAESPLAEAVHPRANFLPPVERYAHDIGYGPDAGLPGVPHDIGLELGPRAGFEASFAGWDKVLAELEQMGPRAMGQLGFERVVQPYTGDPVRAFGAGWWKGNTLDERQRAWAREISSRLGDLDAARQLAGHGALPAELVPLIEAQAARLQPFAQHEPFSTARGALGDIVGGHARPSQVADYAGPEGYLGHLPVDERAVRKLMAQTQREDALAQVEGRLRHQGLDEGRPFGGQVEELLGTEQDPATLASILHDFLDPRNLAYEGIEPGIAKEVITNPPAGPQGDLVRELQAVLERLRGTPTRDQRLARMHAEDTARLDALNAGGVGAHLR